jgi:hypothetical protein
MTGYREGVKTEVEVVDARSSLTEARGNYYQALYDHVRGAVVAGERATGTLGKDLTLPEAWAHPDALRSEDTEGHFLDAVESLLLDSGDGGKAGEEMKAFLRAVDLCGSGCGDRGGWGYGYRCASRKRIRRRVRRSWCRWR